MNKSTKLAISTMQTDLSDTFSHTDFSYGVVADSFKRCLPSGNGIIEFVPKPELIPARSNNLTPLFHFMIRKFRAIRPIANAYNISIISWEFDKLQDSHTITEGIFYNQVLMLSLADEIWVASRHLLSVLKSYGFSNVHWIPCPIGKPYLEGCSAEYLLNMKNQHSRKVGKLGFIQCISGGMLHAERDNLSDESLRQPLFNYFENVNNCDVFLSVLNPFDLRKNLETMLLAFDSVAQDNKYCLLIVKCNSGLTSSEALLTLIESNCNSKKALISNRIVFIQENMSEKDLCHLYEISDFYLCTSHGEGQNLPLLESMARGCIPISTNNTAMADSVKNVNAIVIESTAEIITANKPVCFHTISDLKWYVCNPQSVAQAITHASTLTTQQRLEKIRQSLNILNSSFSDDFVRKQIQLRMMEFGH